MTGDNEVEGIINEKQPLAVFKTRVLDERNIEITICEQQRTNFMLKVYVDEEGNCYDYRPNNEAKQVIIASESVIEYIEPYTLYLKGCYDFDNENIRTIIPLKNWRYFEAALKYFGCLIDEKIKIEEQKEEIENKIDYSCNVGEPTKEEIEKMISLVDLPTFCKVLKNRISIDIKNKHKEDCKEILGKINSNWAKKFLVDWAKAKYRFYKIFGDKLVLEKDIEITPTENDFRNELEILKNKFPLYTRILKDISMSAIMKNEINKRNLTEFYFSDKKVKENMKLTKFISLFGCKELDTEFSLIYTNKGKTKISISINPIDYLTVSINGSGWKSCHCLYDGCYCNAGLSYMNDETSMVAYSSNSDIRYGYEFPFIWNSKRWRQMVYMSNKSSTTVFSRQYPFNSDELSKNVRKLLEDKVSKYYNSNNLWKVYRSVEELNVEVEKDSYANVYNDVVEGYAHKVIKAKDDLYNKGETIYIGERATALNDKDYYIGDNNSLINFNIIKKSESEKKEKELKIVRPAYFDFTGVDVHISEISLD